MTTYIFEVSLCWMGFYSVYFLLLSRETFFNLNRGYLLTTALLGVVIPLVNFTSIFPSAENDALYYFQPIAIGIEQIEVAIIQAAPEDGFNMMSLLNPLYWIGFVFFGLRLLIGLFQLRTYLNNAETFESNSYQVVNTKKSHAPFSFFNNLFWSSHFRTTEEERINIFRHEEAHIIQKHSIDVMILEILGIVFWCSPFIYLYKNSLKTVHEYLADAFVLKTANRKQYGHLLLRQSQSGPKIVLMNALFNSQLKKRIVMMTKNKSSRIVALKYLVIVPLLIVLCMAFSEKENAISTPQLIPNLAMPDTVPASDEIFNIVEEMPRFPGCEELSGEKQQSCSNQKMTEFIYQGIRYPKEAREKKMEGMVVVRFVIEKNGKTSGAEIVRSVGGGCDEEVLRIVENMPTWIPGKQRGRLVRVQYVLPVKFKLDNEVSKKGSEIVPETTAEEVFKIVEESPMFPGCQDLPLDERKACADKKMLEFVYQGIKYPKEAKERGVEGMVVVKFIIEKDGAITNAEIIRSVGSGCDEEVLRVIGSMPNWIPGQQRGRKVRVQYNLPVKFKLSDGVTEKSPMQKGELRAFPNPVRNTLTVEFETDPGAVILTLVDFSGRELFKQVFTSYDGNLKKVSDIDISKHAEGALVLTLSDSKGAILKSIQVSVQ